MAQPKMVDVILINPADPPATYTPLGICYLAAVLEKAGISVQIIDRASQHLSDEEVVQKLAIYKPKVVGITIMTTLLQSAYNIIRLSKERNLPCTFLVGGPYINIEPEIIVPMNADYAIMGDAELSIAGFSIL